MYAYWYQKTGGMIEPPMHYWHQSVVRTVTNTELTLIDGVNNHQHAIDTLKPCPYTQDHTHFIACGVVAEAEADSNPKA